jgi:hypothetical protein
MSATGDSNTELAIRKKIFDDLIVKDSHKERAGEATKSSTHAKGSDASEIVGVLMEGNEVVGGESIMDGRRKLVIEDNAKKASERGEVGMEQLVGVSECVC